MNRRALHTLLRPYLPEIASLTGAMVATSLFSLGYPLLSGRVVNAILHGEMAKAAIAAAALALAVIAAGVGWYASAGFATRTIASISHGLRMRLHAKLAALDLAVLLSTSDAKIRNHLDADVNAIASAYQNTVIPALSALITLAMAVISMVWIDWRLASVAVLGLVPSIATYGRSSRKSEEIRRAFSEANDRFGAGIIAYLSAAGVLRSRAFGVFGADMRRFEDVATPLRTTFVRSGDQYGKQQLLLLVSSGCTMGALLLLGIFLISNGKASPGALVAFLAFQQMIHGSATVLSTVQFQIASITVAARRLLRVFDAPAAAWGHTAVAGDVVELCEATFFYPESESGVAGVSVMIRRGEKVAVIGKSGSGKSTLLLLLQGLYRAQSGELRIDGIPSAECDERSVRRLFGYTSDALGFIPGSIHENIAYGAPSATRADVTRCIRLAGLADDVDALAHGLDSPLGVHGEALSTGQLQRLGVARALAVGAPFLMLDEPTSGVDAEMERQIIEDCRAHSGAVVLVTHCPPAALAFDRVLVMDGGRLVYDGDPEHCDALRSAVSIGS